ncbi:MAG: hypothetical protein ACK5LP_07810 [Campylobacteraceae bacterium]
MKKIVLGLVGLALVASFANAKKLDFSDYGFVINNPEVSKNEKVRQPVIIFLNPTDPRYTPNINIQVQDFNSTIEEYEKISQETLQQVGGTLINKSINRKVLVIEYKIKHGEAEVHYYARAVLDAKTNTIYLATGSVLDSEWNIHGKKIRDSVLSLNLK